MAKNFYGVLGVAQTATEEEIRRTFRELARQRHPDRFEGAEKVKAEREFQEITEAFNVLADARRRRIHDRELEGAGRGPASPRTGGSAPSASGAEDQAKLLRAVLAEGVKAYKRQDFAAAAESFGRATRIDPGSPQAWYNLALTQSHQSGGGPRARRAIEKACELEPMKPAYLKLAGRLYAEAGMKSRAEGFLENALAWGGPDDEVESTLAALRGESRGRRGFFGKVR